MFEDLGKLLVSIQECYDKICNMWSASEAVKFNLKKKQVIDTRKNDDILKCIWEYRSLVNEEHINIRFYLNNNKFSNSNIDSRVKAQNSIEYKLDNYYMNHEHGRTPLKKCMNDLLGIRIVLDEEFTHQEILSYMENNFPEYKCIDSSKYSYVATHIYIENGNTFFPWELQVWSKKNEKNNYLSHKAYKQGYTKWEEENKGGVEFD